MVAFLNSTSQLLSPISLADPVALLLWLLRTSAGAAVVAGLVLLAQAAFGRWLPAQWQYRLWALVVLRLLLPALPASPTSVWNLGVFDPVRRLLATPPARPDLGRAGLSNPSDDNATEPLSQRVTHPRWTVTVRVDPLRPAVRSNGVSDGAAAGVPSPGSPGFPAHPLPPADPAAAGASISPLPVALGAAWLAGVAVLLARLVTSNVAFARRLRAARPVTDAASLALLAEGCHATGLRRVPPLLESDAIHGPAAAGVWRPRLLVPPGLLDTLSTAERRAVLLHELAHVRCRDVAANWLLASLQAVHWFNPLLWLAFARLRADREAARDAMVLAVAAATDAASPDVTDAAKGYARTLLKLAERLSPRPGCPESTAIVSAAGVAGLVGIVEDVCPTRHPLTPGFFGPLGGRGNLRRRLHMITRFPTTSRRLGAAGPLLLLALACGTLTGPANSAPANAGPADPAPRAATQPAPAAPEPEQSTADLIAAARRLTEQGLYAEALREVDRILAREPRNDYAAGVRPLLEDKASAAEQRKFRERIDIEAQKALVPADEKKVPYDDVLKLPQDWPDERARHADVAAQARALQAQLDRMMPEVKFEGVSLGDGIEFLRDVSGANIFVNWKALESVGVDRKTAVTMRLVNVRFAKALSAMLEAASAGKGKLGYTTDEGVITVSTADDLVKGTTVTRVYDIRDLLIEIPNYEPADAAPPRLQPATRPAAGSGQAPAPPAPDLNTAPYLDDNDVSAAAVRKHLEAQQREGKPLAVKVRGTLSNPAVLRIFDDFDVRYVFTNFEGEDRVARTRAVADLVLLSARSKNAFVGNFSTPPDAGTGPIEPAALPRKAVRPREELVREVVKLITDTVAPDTWKDNGGSVGSLRELQGQLVVTQTPENHRQLVNLLGQLREIKGIQVTVEARFVACDEDVPRNLLAEWVKQRAPAGPPATQPATRPAAAFLGQEEVDQFMRAVQSDKDSRTLAAPRLTLFNGQRAYVLVSTQHAYVRDFAAVRDGDGRMRYEPLHGTADAGLLLDVTATTSADRKYVTLTLRPKLTAVTAMKQVPWPGRPAGSDLMVQEPATKVSELQTTVSIPDGGYVLLGGLEDPGLNLAPATQPVPHVPQPALQRAGQPRSLYLLVRPKLILQRQADQPQFPLLSPRSATKPGD